MNQELFNHMQKQMNPSPEIREALTKKLAHPAKKRPVPWRKYGAVAACAALLVGVFPLYRAMNPGRELPLHSYVTVEGLTGFVQENAAVNDTGTGGEDIGSIEILPAPNTGDLPGGAYVGDVPSQEEALQAVDKLAPHVRSNPDWYGGAYIDNTGTLIVCLVEDQDPGDKTLELQVLDWTDNGRVGFTSVKYSLARLNELMEQLNTLPAADPECRQVMASWSRDEMNNRVDVTLTEANDHILSILAELDPDDDAIYVQVGQRASTDNAKTEDPAVHHVMPGGVPAPDDEDLIAEEPYYDGAHYDVEKLPENLPQEKLPATTVDSASEEDASTSSWFPQD